MYQNDKVCNEQEAYILGFLYADGFVTCERNGKYYVIGSTVSLKDEQIIIDISNHFNNAKIKYKNQNCQTGNFDAISLQICDVKLVEKIINLGLRPQKTYENNSFIFDNIPDSLKHHFLRGYFDSDGSIGIYDNKCRFGLVSCNNRLLEAILKFI